MKINGGDNMRACLLVLVVACMFCGVAQAETVRLKNGNTVEGKVIERTADGVKIDIGGVTLTYYSDEIESIDAAAQTAVAPVPVPEAAAPVVAEAVQQEPAVPVAVEAPVVSAAFAASDDLANMSKEDLIKKFVQIYGVKENMQANFDQMIATLKQEQADAFRQSVKVDDIIQLLLPIYDKHFSADDLRAYIRFYSSTEGKKLVQALPLLMKDSVDVSMKYLDSHLPESLKQEEAAPSDGAAPASGN
jgi:hypothetical protein